MWFNPPTMLMIPFFLHVKALGLDNTRTSVILAFAANAFNVILLRTYFQSIPDSMEESAKIDGANDLSILWKIILPLSIPAVATISLYYAVSRWNGYFWTMVFIKDPAKIPLQVLLRKLVVEMSFVSELGSDYTAYTPETFVYATIIVGIIPMMIAYPFIQKYFVKGIMVGALKE
jgi:putative aldouronate transport system permease protein